MALQMLDSSDFKEDYEFMIMLIVEHLVDDSDLEVAKDYLLKKAEEQSTQPGFIRRFTVQSLEDQRKLTTVTLWRNMSDYEHWINEVLPDLRGKKSFSFIEHHSELSVVDDERLPNQP